jgi:hypothetical protein
MQAYLRTVKRTTFAPGLMETGSHEMEPPRNCALASAHAASRMLVRSSMAAFRVRSAERMLSTPGRYKTTGRADFTAP